MEATQTISDYERERGKPMPSINHSRIQQILAVALSRYEPRYTIFSELSLELGGLRVTPDLSVCPEMRIDFAQDRVRMTEPPLLTVEIESPTQSTQDLADKARAMLQAGVHSCWLVQPAIRAVTIFSEDKQPETFTQGKITDPATDIEVALEDIFPTHREHE